MPEARRIQGELVFPDDATPAVAVRAVVELRDVSVLDQPSRTLAVFHLEGLTVRPGARVAFDFTAPAAPAADALSLRAAARLSSDRRDGQDDYLTTASHPIAPTGDACGLEVCLSRP
jgi:hypothetical protein